MGKLQVYTLSGRGFLWLLLKHVLTQPFPLGADFCLLHANVKDRVPNAGHHLAAENLWARRESDRGGGQMFGDVRLY